MAGTSRQGAVAVDRDDGVAWSLAMT